MKSLNVLIDGLYVVIFISAIIQMFWMPFLGTTFWEVIMAIFMVAVSASYITNRVSELQVTTRTYTAGKRSATVISVEKKGVQNEKSSED